MQRGLQKLANKAFVSAPSTAQDIVHAFQLEAIWSHWKNKTGYAEPTPFYKACMQEKNFSFCIFGSDKTIKLINENIYICEQSELFNGRYI